MDRRQGCIFCIILAWWPKLFQWQCGRQTEAVCSSRLRGVIVLKNSVTLGSLPLFRSVLHQPETMFEHNPASVLR